MTELVNDKVYTHKPELLDKTDQLISTENLIPSKRQVTRKDVDAFVKKLKEKKAIDKKQD